jgi:NTE family protein
VRDRRAAGLADARRMIAQAPWQTAAVDPIEGVIEHR